MSDYDKTEQLLKALADKSRLKILELIQEEISNPGDIARRLQRHRSTIEKHLRVLLKANVVEKVPSLTKDGHLAIKYKIRAEASQLLTIVKDACREF